MIEIQHQPTRVLLELEKTQASTFIVEEDTKIQINYVIWAEIKAKTEWVLVGQIPQGDVFKAKNSVFSIQSANVHEAYLVLVETKLVGFYLPFEKAYSPAGQAVTLNVKIRR